MSKISTKTKKPQFSEEQILEVKEAFNVFDSEQKGGLDARELKAAISALNIKITKFTQGKAIPPFIIKLF